MRGTRSTTCVVKRSLVEAEEMTGTHELCMLIDGVVPERHLVVLEVLMVTRSRS